MNKCRILFVGGGSNAWVPNIVKDLMLTEPLGGSEIVLYDIDKKASDYNKIFLDKLSRQLGVPFTITSTDKKAEAFSKADYVIIAISTGGLKSMAYDLSIPEDYGIYHTVGDTSGPGGWARSIRNYSAFVDLANSINQYCPLAFVLNYTNPMVFLTDILQRICRGPVIGLCHGLFENIEVFRELYRVECEDEIHLKYGGLNHFFWITEATYRQTDIIEDFRKRLKRKTLSDLLPKSKADPMGFSSGRAVADELYRVTGVIPYFGDRHTCEFFCRYITKKDTMRKYNIQRTSIKDRKRLFADRGAELKKAVGGKIPESYLKKSRETAADIINAHFTGNRFIDVGNVKNIGQISNLPLGTVVETACAIDKNGVTPLSFGELPEVITGFCDPYARSYNMTVKACLENDREMALRALSLDPVCAHLTWAEVKEMGLKLLRAHKKYITKW